MDQHKGNLDHLRVVSEVIALTDGDLIPLVVCDASLRLAFQIRSILLAFIVVGVLE